MFGTYDLGPQKQGKGACWANPGPREGSGCLPVASQAPPACPVGV